MAANDCATETAVIGVLGAYVAVTLLVGLLTGLVSETLPLPGEPCAARPVAAAPLTTE